MICPQCENEFIDGIKECPECKKDLVSIDEFEGHLVTPKDWAIVYESELAYEADMLKANLEGADIETLILNQQDRNFPAQGDFSVIKVMVRKNDAAEALKIINDIKNSELEEGEETE